MKFYLIITAVICALLILFPLSLVGITTENEETTTALTQIYETSVT